MRDAETEFFSKLRDGKRRSSYEGSAVFENSLLSRSGIKGIVTTVEKRIDTCRNKTPRISSQITLLSLNATIEAARAGKQDEKLASRHARCAHWPSR
ncbi:MAG: hypothetical protein KF682_04415 [Nitrospira sp.]|nr:hypothetical protein [Nitrospira sp.]